MAVEESCMQDELSNEQGFTVRDKRRFAEGGESRPLQDPGLGNEKAEEDKKGPEKDVGREQDSRNQSSEKQLPPMDFSGFIVGLAETTLFQLGFLRIPGQEEVSKDLQAAKHTIDLVALLEEKTRGNLTDQEKKILSDTLFQLRMAFVEASKP